MNQQFEEKDYTKELDLKLWRKLIVFLRAYKLELAGLAFVMILVALIDALIPIMTKIAIDDYIAPGNIAGLKYFGLGYAGIILIQAINVFLLIAIAGRIEVGLCYDIRKAGFKKLQELPFGYYDKTPVGWLMARMTSDSMKLGETISWGFVDGIWGFSMMTAVAAFMFAMNWKLALITMAVLPLLAIISNFFQKRILGSYRKVRKTNSKISGAYNEGITGAKTTKTLVREAANLEEFKDLTRSMRASSIRAAIFSSLYMPVVLILSSIGTALALWYGGSGVLTGVITYGTLVAFLSYTVQFFEPVRELARLLAELQSAQAAAERIVSLIETEADIADSPEVVAVYGDNFHPRTENWPLMKGDIEFENVTFQYKDGERVLKDFSLKVKAGETVALVGETGSGKSTIVNLACRFYEPSEGIIKIDGVDYRERSQLWLHSNLGYVLQSPHLFSGSIRENIRYGRLDATNEEVEEAAKLVNAHQFISKLEKGYDGEVGEGGAMLSVGEKQLVSFARAMLANPALFVLDEATSSIDTETEQLIQHAIEKVLENRTSFIIAHRLSTIRSADRILVIKEGEAIENGSHTELMNAKGYYYRLYTNQFIEEKEEDLLLHA